MFKEHIPTESGQVTENPTPFTRPPNQAPGVREACVVDMPACVLPGLHRESPAATCAMSYLQITAECVGATAKSPCPNSAGRSARALSALWRQLRVDGSARGLARSPVDMFGAAALRLGPKACCGAEEGARADQHYTGPQDSNFSTRANSCRSQDSGHKAQVAACTSKAAATRAGSATHKEVPTDASRGGSRSEVTVGCQSSS